MILTIVLIRERNDIVLDLFESTRTYVKRYLILIIFLILLVIVGNLQLNFAELGNDIVKAIAKHWVGLMLVDLQVELLEEFVLPLY